MLLTIIQLIRPQQYVKNGFIFLPFFFSLQTLTSAIALDLILAFFSFSFIASTVYIFNDAIDINRDRAHPSKKNRPLAAGTISVKQAGLVGLVLLFFGLGLSFQQQTIWLVSFYLILNFFYSIKLKHIAIVDVFIIASGFVIRLFVGALVADVILSTWIVIMTFLLALFLAISKRKGDLLKLENHDSRPVLDDYNQEYLNVCMSIMASVVIVAYIMYSLYPMVLDHTGSNYVYVTSVFVLFGILRYLKIILFDQTSGNPTRILLSDRLLQLTILGWLLTFAGIFHL